MKKNDLLNFIGRYHLAGATTSVKWVAQDGTLQTNFITDDQNVIGTINSTNLDLGNHELGVYATPALVKMLSAIGDSLDVDVNAVDKTAVSIGINDKDIDMTFMTLLVFEHINIIRALSFCKTLSFLLAASLSQIETFRRTYEEFGLTLKSRTIKPLRERNKREFLGAMFFYFFKKAHHNSDELSLSLKARGFFDRM